MKCISLIALCCAGAALLHGASNDGDAAVVRILNCIHVVNSLDKTVAFYHEIFELDGQTQFSPNGGVPALTNSPSAHMRLVLLHLPNTSFGLELTEFSGVERKPGRPRISDPGAGTLICVCGI